MSLERVARSTLLVAVLASWHGWASAAPETNAPRAATQAQRLFDDALGLLDQDRPREACPLLEQSLELDPGLGTQFQLAECYERIGKHASAYRLFDLVAQRCTALSAREHEQLARSRQRALEERLEYLEISLAKPSATIELWLDGDRVARDAWSKPLPIDPGTHQVEAREGPQVVFQRTLVISPGVRRTTLSVDPLERERPLPTATFARVSAPVGRVELDGPIDRHSGYRWLGTVTLGVGAIGLSLGGVYGLVALSKKRDSDAQCDEVDGRQQCHTTAARDAHNEAVEAGDRSTIFFAAGSVLTATGVALLLALPRGSESSVTAGVGFAPNGAIARVGGRF